MTVELPEGWEATDLGSVASESKARWAPEVGSGLPYVGLEHIERETGALLGRGTSSDVTSQKTVFESGDILFGKLRPNLRKVARAPFAGVCSTDILAVRSKPQVCSEFLFHELLWNRTSNYAVQSAAGTKMPRTSWKLMAEMPLTLPPLSEQKRIAEVLTNADDVIRATKVVIEQTRKVKKGLLQTLLTQGLGHTKFKPSPLGGIPESWEVVKLESLLASSQTPMRSGPFGSALKKSELVANGVPFLGIDNVHVEQFVTSFKRFVTPQKAEELKRFTVQAGDVMITIMGTVGRCCVVPEDAAGALSSKHVWTMTFDPEKYIPELICWQLNFAPWVLSEFLRTSQGGIMCAINSKILKGLLLPWPPIGEQKKIAQILASFNERIETNEQKLAQLQTLKSGLMSDLLTGRVRVKGAA